MSILHAWKDSPLGQIAQSIHQQDRHQQSVQLAAMRILAAIPPSAAAADRVFAEVERRAKVFAGVAQTSPRIHEHPRLAALESVLNDVTHGRLT